MYDDRHDAVFPACAGIAVYALEQNSFAAAVFEVEYEFSVAPLFRLAFLRSIDFG